MKKNIIFFLGVVLCCSCMNDNASSSFTDPRDGEVYTTVKIGTQVWMAENLRYNVEGSYLNPANPDKKYGRLYTWEQAMQACPSGWYLPSDAEWKILEIYLGLSVAEADEEKRGVHGNALKSQSNWAENGNGTDSSGFSALPAGCLYAYNGTFDGLGRYANFWSSTETESDAVWYRNLYSGSLGVFRYYNSKFHGLSCRCLKEPRQQTKETSENATNNLKENKTTVVANSFTDSRDGEVYSTVKIGEQVWMAENIRYSANGSIGICYDNMEVNCDKYGRLYTWNHAKEACPRGWHLPSDTDWNTLEIFLGLSAVKADEIYWRGNHGSSMKSQSSWNRNDKGTNSLGFNVLPAGYYYADGLKFEGIGSYALFWSSTEYDSNVAWYRSLDSYDSGVYRDSNIKLRGKSCRCVKD